MVEFIHKAYRGGGSPCLGPGSKYCTRTQLTIFRKMLIPNMGVYELRSCFP